LIRGEERRVNEKKEKEEKKKNKKEEFAAVVRVSLGTEEVNSRGLDSFYTPYH
jgi:hypothetical protein